MPSLFSFSHALDQLEDDDEVLLVIAEHLGGYVDLVGGAAESKCLIPILEQLAMVEETVVREKVRRVCELLLRLLLRPLSPCPAPPAPRLLL